MKKSYLLIAFTFAAMLVVPTVYGQSDNVEMHDIVEWQAGWARDCPEVRDRDGDDPHIIWKCNAEAIIAWCFKNIVMSHDANEQQKQNARYNECGNREGYKELLHNHPGYGAVSTVHKPGDKVRFHLPQNAKRATVYYSYCPYIQYVPIMNVDSGTFYCDPIFEFETSLDSSASGNQDSADADDLYERLFGELESRLSVLLGDSGFSDEVFGNLLELLGSELSFEDALGNIGRGQTESDDRGNEQVASGDQESKQSDLSASPSACKEYLVAVDNYLKAARMGHLYLSKGNDISVYDVARSLGVGERVIEDASNISTQAFNAAVIEEWERGNEHFPDTYQQWIKLIEEVVIPAFLEHVGVCVAP